MAVSFYVLLWIGGGNDLIASFFDMSINTITWFLRFAIFLVPPLVFVATKRICLGLQRRDRDKLLHGMETGNILRLPHGERHQHRAGGHGDVGGRLALGEANGQAVVGDDAAVLDDLVRHGRVSFAAGGRHRRAP